MRRRTLATLAALAVLAAACGGAPAEEAEEPAPPAATAAERVAARATVARAPIPAEVPLHRPDLRIDAEGPVDLEAVRAIDGVDLAVGAARLELTTVSGTDPQTVEALVVDPLSFRPLTPDTTALEPGVWERLVEGNVVLTPAAGHRIGAILGENVALSGPRTTEALRIGAFAANGLPPVADVLVPWEVGRRLGADGENTVLVAVADGAPLGEVREALAAVTNTEVEVLEEPEARQETTQSVGRSTLEPFTYQSVGDGTIRIDPDWVRRNIVTAEVPILGTVRCHRVMVDQMAAALHEIHAAGLAGLITDYSGCYVPRHMLWNPSKSISRHAWGLAFDINVPTNGYGVTPTLDMRIVEILRKWGFKWGGDFAIPDGMHFELERIVTPS
jgi:hypothetical protein